MDREFTPSKRTNARRRPDRVRYDKAAVYAVLDASLLCHVGYVIDGEPFVTPTAFWRVNDTLYWHGSRQNNMINKVTGERARACVTVGHLDGLIAGRSGKGTSVQYRSVMAFGHPEAITGRDAKRRAMNVFIERMYPGRTEEIRPALDQELDEITVVEMLIEEASVKVKTDGVIEMREEDYEVPAWAGVIPIEMRVGKPQSDGRLAGNVQPSASITPYEEGVRLDGVLARLAVRQKAG